MMMSKILGNLNILQRLKKREGGNEAAATWGRSGRETSLKVLRIGCIPIQDRIGLRRTHIQN